MENNEKMPGLFYRLMVGVMNVEDLFFPRIEKRVEAFGIATGMTVVDYACGPGRYTVFYSRLVGPQGKVYAVDIHEMAIAILNKKVARYGLANVEPVLAQGYASGLPAACADLVTALDVFFAIQNPTAFLAELKRIVKPEGTLILDDGHQPRAATLKKLTTAGGWTIVDESKDHLKCRPV
jgi:ubiquinone/menaquinone biosynthesis C-methylase UbiE